MILHVFLQRVLHFCHISACGPIMNNVISNELLSEDWCKEIFDGRNKAYGAYVLRRDAGVRYRKAMLGVCILALVFLMGIAAKMLLHKAVMLTLDEDMPTARIKPMEAEEGHELKAVATTRQEVRPVSTEGQVDAVPDIVENLPPKLDFGVEGPAVLQTDNETFINIEADTLMAEVREDLPSGGEQLTPVEVVEEMPQFPGGWRALAKFMDQNVAYPSEAIKNRTYGDVEVAFIVDKEGRVTNPRVTKTLSPALDRAALEAIQKMPRWKPGQSGGKVSMVQVRIPIHFQVD